MLFAKLSYFVDNTTKDAVLGIVELNRQ